MEIKSLLDLNIINPNVLNNEEKKRLKFFKEEILNEDNKRHLSIPVYSYVRPTVGSQFILHILLSLGHFVTEVDLLLHATIRESLLYEKLIGPSNDTGELQKYPDEILKQFILLQLQYCPNSNRFFDTWIVTAGEVLDSIIFRNEIPIHNIPPFQQATLPASKVEKVVKH